MLSQFSIFFYWNNCKGSRDTVMLTLDVKSLHREIKGIKIASTENEIGLYADDIVLYLSNLKTSLKHTLQVFTEFANISGLSINSINRSTVIHFHCGSCQICKLSLQIKEFTPFSWKNSIKVQFSNFSSQFCEYIIICLCKKKLYSRFINIIKSHPT